LRGAIPRATPRSRPHAQAHRWRLTHIFQAAAPIAIERRDDFLEAVAAILLGSAGPIGPGTVHRAIAQAQRLYFDPPENDRTPSRARWDRDAPRFEKVSKQAAG
jgi:hypothetical protein